MPVISDINPNSLGPLQPIRAPQVPISIPNPLSVAPFFQGQQLRQNERQLDQRDIAMALQEKQMDFAQSQLLFQQTKELLDMGDLAFDSAYKEHTARTSQASGNPANLGLDLSRPAHMKVWERHNTGIEDFYGKMANAYKSASNAGDSKGINQLLIDTKAGLSKNRQALQQDPEYMEFAGMQTKYNMFMNRLAKQQENGLSVDERERRRVESLYNEYTSGAPLTNAQKGELKRQLSDTFIGDITFDRKSADFNEAAIVKAATTPQTYSKYNSNVPDAPGFLIGEEHRVDRDPQEVLNDIIGAFRTDPNIVKKFKAFSGTTPEENEEGFVNWVAGRVKFYIPEGGDFITKIGQIIIDPQEVLKNKTAAAARGTAAQNPYGSDSAGARAQLQENDYTRAGLEPAPGYGQAEIFDVSQMKPGTTLTKINPTTGNTEIYRVKVDAQGNPEIEPKIDPNTGKEIPNSDGVVPLGDPILILRKRTTVPAGVGGTNNTVYGDYAVTARDGADGSTKTLAPTIGNARQTVQRVAELRKQGVKHAVVRVGENREESNTATSPAGDIGLFQFNPDSHKPAFLKEIDQPDWKTAITKLGDGEFRRLQEEYYDKHIFNPAIKEVNDKLSKAIPDIDITKDGYWEGVREYIGSTFNQSGPIGQKEIVNSAIRRFDKTYNPFDDFESAKTFLGLLREERAKYIIGLGPTVRTEAGLTDPQWEEAAINRSFRDYIGSLSIMRDTSGIEIPELDNILRGGTPVANGKSAIAAGSGSSSPQATSTSIGTASPTAVPITPTGDTAAKRIALDQGVTDVEYLQVARDYGIDLDNPLGVDRTDVGVGALLDRAPGTIPLAVNEAALEQRKEQLDEKNRKREEKGEAFVEDMADSTYKKLFDVIETQKQWYTKQLEKIKPILREKAIETEFKDGANKAYDLFASDLQFTLDDSEDEFDLGTLSDGKLDGTITESKKFKGKYLVRIPGRKVEWLENTQELRDWIATNLKSVAFNTHDPIALQQEIDKQNTPPTAAPAQTAPTSVPKPNVVNKYYGN